MSSGPLTYYWQLSVDGEAKEMRCRTCDCVIGVLSRTEWRDASFKDLMTQAKSFISEHRETEGHTLNDLAKGG